jgi:hypothetical protein
MGLQEELNKAVAAERLIELQKLPVITLGELLKKLDSLETEYESYDGKLEPKSVRFNFGSLVPTDFASWRGVYAEIALGYGMQGYDGDDKAPTLAEFIEQVRATIGSTYEGWKGGDFTMTEDTPVWIDNPGNYTNTMLVDIQDDKYSVTLLGVQQKEV